MGIPGVRGLPGRHDVHARRALARRDDRVARAPGLEHERRLRAARGQPIAEIFALLRTATNLLNTYVGNDAGASDSVPISVPSSASNGWRFSSHRTNSAPDSPFMICKISVLSG